MQEDLNDITDDESDINKPTGSFFRGVAILFVVTLYLVIFLKILFLD